LINNNKYKAVIMARSSKESVNGGGVAKNRGKGLLSSSARKPLRTKATAKDQENVKLAKASTSVKKKQKDEKKTKADVNEAKSKASAEQVVIPKVAIKLNDLHEFSRSSFHYHCHEVASEALCLGYSMDQEDIVAAFKPFSYVSNLGGGEQGLLRHMLSEEVRSEVHTSEVKRRVIPDLTELYSKFLAQEWVPPIKLSDNGIDLFENERIRSCPDDCDYEELKERHFEGIECRDNKPTSPWAFGEKDADLELIDEKDLEEYFADSDMTL
jgi:hypothetical protein